MSEREELEERLAEARIALDNARADFDNAAAELDAYNAAHPEHGDADKTGARP